MKRLKNLANPLVAFIAIQVVWGLLVFFWIYWFIGRSREFAALAERYKPDLVHGHDWLVLAEGLILLVIILAGIYVIFLYWNWQSRLYKQQQAFISQVTHELKSPLASIRLHLETLRMRDLPRDRLLTFLDTMLDDTDRLHNLIENLLMTAKLEQRRDASAYSVIDFSVFVRKFCEDSRKRLPAGGVLTAHIAEGVNALVAPDEMETALRNLFENAVLYSIDVPDITVTLTMSGRRCILTFEDRGKGLPAVEQKHIFKKFYRVRRPGENIKGTGLGLYIVKSVVEGHGGSIAVRSEGPGRGTSFIIVLPLQTQSDDKVRE